MRTRDRPKFGFGFGYGAETGDILASVTAVSVKHDFGLLSITAETTTMFRRELKLSLIAFASSTADVLLMSALSRSERELNQSCVIR